MATPRQSLPLILVSDLKGAVGVSESAIAERANDLHDYGLGDVDEIVTDFGPEPAERIRNPPSGWPFWADIIVICEKANESIEVFTEDLDFARLDK